METSEEILDGEPPAIEPYQVLGLDRSATSEQIKSAYRKAALKHHPDKVPEDQRQYAHEKFQSIAFAYAILSDSARRKRYDTTGSTSESIIDSEGFDWSDYYREQYRDSISADAIKKFAKKYKKSIEEVDDVLVAYENCEGDMNGVYESVMLSNVLEDDARFRAIIDGAISRGDVSPFPAYTKESKKKREDRLKAARAEANEAEEYAKELGVYDNLFGKKKKNKDQSEDGLAALIKSNQKKRENFLDDIAAKYATNSKASRGKKRPVDEEPSEEAFQAAAARLRKGKSTLDAAANVKASKGSKR